jgi:hypothetical protein
MGEKHTVRAILSRLKDMQKKFNNGVYPELENTLYEDLNKRK